MIKVPSLFEDSHPGGTSAAFDINYSSKSRMFDINEDAGFAKLART